MEDNTLAVFLDGELNSAHWNYPVGLFMPTESAILKLTANEAEMGITAVDNLRVWDNGDHGYGPQLSSHLEGIEYRQWWFNRMMIHPGEWIYAEAESAQPATFRLPQNYPNPFNPATIIPFTLPETGYVTLTVYDIQGRRVTTLQEGLMDRGEHRVTFDAEGLSSGIYYYELDIDGKSHTRPMLLQK